MISTTAFLRVELVSAALLALWVVVRYPHLGPKSLRPAMALSAVVLAGLRLASFGAGLMMRLPDGAYATLFGCALPGFFATFLAAAWLMRVLAGALGGQGRGPGHRIPARSGS
jgi:hypothetical protein